jgi:hypothetical protein
MVHAYNPSTWEAEQDDHNFEASLRYIARPYLNNNKKENYEKMKEIKDDLSKYKNTSCSCIGIQHMQDVNSP